MFDLATAGGFAPYIQQEERYKASLFMKTPYEIVTDNYALPFDLWAFQQKIVNDLGPLERAGYYLDQGVGKTATSTASTLYKLSTDEIDTCIVLMPPILIQGWYRFLTQIAGLKVVRYMGTPVERGKIKMNGHFILMSMQIFKRDFQQIDLAMKGKRLNLLIDEAHMIKNIGSDNHRKVRDFATGQHMMLLTGTPLTTPMDGYAFCKLIAPHLYRSLRHFENLHVEERDFFGSVTKWQNLDLLAANMKVNSARVLREEVLLDLPPVQYTPMFYNLESKHLRLYNRLAEEQMLKLESGGKIDATTASALYHALQQIVLNHDHFADNPEEKSAGYDLVDQVMDEMDGRKLVIFANYRMSNKKLIDRLQKYNVVAAYGAQTAATNQLSVRRFIEDPKIKVFVAQPTSAGYGVDGLQHVCNNALFLECPVVPRDFHQAVARLYRGGQKESTHIRIAVAEKTIQGRLHRQLLANDEMVNGLVGGWKNLREALYGN